MTTLGESHLVGSIFVEFASAKSTEMVFEACRVVSIPLAVIGNEAHAQDPASVLRLSGWTIEKRGEELARLVTTARYFVMRTNQHHIFGKA